MEVFCSGSKTFQKFFAAAQNSAKESGQTRTHARSQAKTCATRAVKGSNNSKLRNLRSFSNFRKLSQNFKKFSETSEKTFSTSRAALPAPFERRARERSSMARVLRPLRPPRLARARLAVPATSRRPPLAAANCRPAASHRKAAQLIK